MSRIVQTSEGYNLLPRFENRVVSLCALSLDFYSRVGQYLEVDRLGSEETKLILRTVQALAKKIGRGPGDATITAQALQAVLDDGKITFQQANRAVEIIEETEEESLSSELIEATIQQVAPIVQRAIRHKASQDVIAICAQGKTLASVVALEEKAKAVGLPQERSLGTPLGVGSFAEITELAKLERMPVGVSRLDFSLGGPPGGLRREAVGTWQGRSGKGKSVALVHCWVTQWLLGCFTLYASLELPRKMVHARGIANLTGIPMELLQSDKEAQRRASEILEKLNPKLGIAVAKFFPARGRPKLEDLKVWIQDEENKWGRSIDCLAVDPGDKVVVFAKDGTPMTGYHHGVAVWDGFRDIAETPRPRGNGEKSGIFLWTASQTQRIIDPKEKVTAERIAGSKAKLDSSELLIAIQNDQDNKELLCFAVEKHTTADSDFTIGPCEASFACAQLGRRQLW